MTVVLRTALGVVMALAFFVGLPVAAVVLVLTRVDVGDCVTAPDADGGVSVVSCEDASAQGRVLVRLDDGGDCLTVPGTTEEVPVEPHSENRADMCVAPKDVPPELSPAVAVPGGCLSDVAIEPVRQTFCSDPGAFRILARGNDDGVLWPSASGCSRVPGSTDTYSWRLVETRYASVPIASRVFCVAPAGAGTPG